MDGVWGEKRGEVVAGLLCRDWVGGWVDGWLAGQEDMAGWGGGEGRLVDSMHGFWSWKYRIY